MFIREKQTENEKAPRRRISKREWFELLKEKRIPSQKLKEEILKFFAVSGNYDLLETFAKEAGIAIPKDIAESKQTIEDRFEIRQLIVKGKVDEAIEKVQNIDENFEKQHPSILFNLKLLKVIKLIQQNQVTTSILLAQKQLVPMAKGRPQYIAEVEKVMTLVAFKDLKNCPNKFLCEEGHPTGIAFEVNQAIAKPTEAQNLTSIAKLHQWCQDRLLTQLDFPILDIRKPELFD